MSHGLTGSAPALPPDPERRPTDPGWVRSGLRSRRFVAGLVVTLLLAVLAVVFEVVRSSAADDRSATTAAVLRAESRVRAADRAEVEVLAAEHRAHARATEVALRVGATTDLTARIAHAAGVLTSSEGKVADDAVRQGLATAMNSARATAEAGPGTPPSGLAASGTTVDSARAAVEAAQATWQGSADAATAAAAKAAAAKPAPPPAEPTAAPGVPVWITSVPTADGDGSNGHMPASAMCLIPWGTDQIGSPQYLRCDATAALTRLNDAFRAKFGEPLAMDLTYRSYDEQERIKAYYGGLAATPGTSNHGLGLALDVQEWPGTYGFGTPRYEWLVGCGPTFGWVAPASVAQDAAYPEYWHFEYRP